MLRSLVNIGLKTLFLFSGVCLPIDSDTAQHPGAEEVVPATFVQEDNSTVEAHSKPASQGKSQPLKGM